LTHDKEFFGLALKSNRC